MEISLTPEREEFLKAIVAKGRYGSPDEAIDVALKWLQDREIERGIKLEALRKEIAIGIEASDRGEVFDGEEVFRELEQELEAKQVERSIQ